MRDFWKRFGRNRGAVAGILLLGVVILAAVLAPALAPHNPWQMAGAPFSKPLETGHLLGTDTLGRDILSGVIYGSRVSLLVGLASTIAAVILGTTIGATAGYVGGRTDDLLMRATEFVQTIPSVMLAIVLVAVLEPSVATITASIAFVSWPPVARLVRSEFLSLRERDFVQSAVTLGKSRTVIILFEILPNALSPIVVMASLMVATAILLESSLSFLGLGDPNTMSWGYMIGASRSTIRIGWWMGVFPGLAIFFTVLAINLVGEGLTDALNPRLHRRSRT
jgi:peptide/nickel transport system permease protein